MLRAMLGIVLEQSDRNILESIDRGFPVCASSLSFEMLKRIKAIKVRPRLKLEWPFIQLAPCLTSIGEDMLYICRNYNQDSDRWFIGSDTLPWLR